MCVRGGGVAERSVCWPCFVGANLKMREGRQVHPRGAGAGSSRRCEKLRVAAPPPRALTPRARAARQIPIPDFISAPSSARPLAAYKLPAHELEEESAPKSSRSAAHPESVTAELLGRCSGAQQRLQSVREAWQNRCCAAPRRTHREADARLDLLRSCSLAACVVAAQNSPFGAAEIHGVVHAQWVMRRADDSNVVNSRSGAERRSRAERSGAAERQMRGRVLRSRAGGAAAGLCVPRRGIGRELRPFPRFCFVSGCMLLSAPLRSTPRGPSPSLSSPP